MSASQSLRPLSPATRAASPRKNLGCVVKNALRAFFTTQPKTSERRGREPALGMKIRHTLSFVIEHVIDDANERGEYRSTQQNEYSDAGVCPESDSETYGAKEHDQP